MQTAIAGRRAGWQTMLDLVVTPVTACHRLRENPTWVWALIITTVISVIAVLATSGATSHVVTTDLINRLQHDPNMAALSPADRQSRIEQVVKLTQISSRIGFVFVPIAIAFSSAVIALVMLVANAIGHGDGSFKKYWSLAINAAFIGNGITSVVYAVIVLARGENGFRDAADLASAVPSIGSFVPPEFRAAHAFLATITPFSVWNAVLVAVGLVVIGRVARPIGVIVALLTLAGAGTVALIPALLNK